MSNPATTKEHTMNTYVTKGSGTAIHIAYVYSGGNLATLCDKWGASGAHSSRIRPVATDAATCKSCMRNATAVTR